MSSIKVLSSKPLYQGFYALVEEEVLLPNGKTVTRAIVKHPGAVVIVPQDHQGRLLLIRQLRVAVREEVLEFPAGTLEAGENPLDCARREIMEEIGMCAGCWQPLGQLVPTPGFCDERQHLFFASNLTPGHAEGDEDEIITVVALTPTELEEKIVSGELKDAKSISAYTRAKLSGILSSCSVKNPR